MKHIYILLALISITAFTTIDAQNSKTRYQKQHNVTDFMKTHLKTSIEMTNRAMENKESKMQNSAIQTLRELQQLFPDESFDSLVQPLITIINDKNMEVETRILAAITLDQLHSETGDDAIFRVSKSCENATLRNVCLGVTKMQDENFPRTADIK
ncbi:MAG: hypothetical protein ACM34K_14505 [Bacillota bacterium]